jgi:DNA-binding NtrC family response regulator
MEMKLSKGKGLVLLIDDESAILEALSELLKASGYSVITADGYDSAVEALNGENQIETIVSDLKMPGKSGLEVQRYVNKQQLGIPLIFLTGFGTLETCQQAIDEGAFSYILKPVDSKDKLLMPVRNALEKYRLEQKTLKMQMDIMQMAERHQMLLDELLADAEIREKIQEQITSVLDKWGG